MIEERLRSSRRHRLCDAGSFEFYQQPKQIYKGKYSKLNNNDRAIYTMIYNRFLLSVKNHFVDVDGYVFIYFVEMDLAKECGIDVKTVRRSINRLKDVHLIEVVQQGCNKPNRIYVLKPEYQVDGENCPIQDLEEEVFLSEGEEILMDREKCPANNTINYTSKDRTSFIDSKNEVERMQEYVKELIGYEELISYDTTKDVKAIEVESVLENILNILVYEVFMADKEKVFNFGSKSNPDKKSVALIQSVFEKSLSRNVVKTYIDQFLKSSNPVNNALVYHIKGLYKQCLSQSSQYLSQGANMHRTYALP